MTTCLAANHTWLARPNGNVGQGAVLACANVGLAALLRGKER
jgi:hypothetical protein